MASSMACFDEWWWTFGLWNQCNNAHTDNYASKVGIQCWKVAMQVLWTYSPILRKNKMTVSFMWKSEDSFEIFGVVKLMQTAIPSFLDQRRQEL